MTSRIAVRQLGCGRSLEQIRGRARSERFGRQIGVLVHRQEHQLDVRQLLLDLTPRFETVQERHRDVEHDDIGLQRSAAATSARPSDTRPTISQSAGEQFLERAEQQRVIVREQGPGV